MFELTARIVAWLRQDSTDLVLQSSLVSEGQICVLDMGVQVKIADLARRLGELSGGSYSIEFIGLRPGEKMFEELTLGDHLEPTSRKYIQASQEAQMSSQWVLQMLNMMAQLCNRRDVGGIRATLGQLVPGYAPSCGIVDDLWLEENVFQFGHVLDDCFAPTVRPR